VAMNGGSGSLLSGKGWWEDTGDSFEGSLESADMT